MPYVSQERRAGIVVRDEHNAAQIGVSKIKTVGELCFALNFMLNHYAYKRSKDADGLRFQTISEIAGAVKVAYDEFNRTVVVPREVSAESNTGAVGHTQAKVNPYNLIDH